MRKRLCSVLLLVLFFSASAETLWAEDYHFASIVSLEEQEVGRLVVPEIYKKLGLDITITAYPGLRAQAQAASGEKDGEIMRIYTYGEENPSLIRVPTPYYQLETIAFIRRDSGVSLLSKEDLSQYNCGIVRGVKHTENITRDMPPARVHRFNNTEEMMVMLERGRIDAALTNTLDGTLLLRKLNTRDIVPLEAPLAVLDLYHYIHQKNKNLVTPVDAVIREMKRTGELAALIKAAEQTIISREGGSP